MPDSRLGRSVASPTKDDLGLAIDLLKRHGMAAVKEAAFVGGGPETARLAEGAESVARVVAYLRVARDDGDRLLDLLAAFRGKRSVTADDIELAEALLVDWEPIHA